MVSILRANGPHSSFSDQVTAQLLLSLDSLEQRLEVSSAKAVEVVSLDDLNEDRGAVHQMLLGISTDPRKKFAGFTYLGEKLEQVATLIKVNQNIQALNRLKVFLQHQSGLLEPGLHVGVICVRDLDELDSAGLQVGDVADDVVCEKGDVLHTGTVVEVHVLLNLRLLLALCGLVDGHLDDLVGGGHDDTLQSGEFTGAMMLM